MLSFALNLPMSGRSNTFMWELKYYKGPIDSLKGRKWTVVFFSKLISISKNKSNFTWTYKYINRPAVTHGAVQVTHRAREGKATKVQKVPSLVNTGWWVGEAWGPRRLLRSRGWEAARRVMGVLGAPWIARFFCLFFFPPSPPVETVSLLLCYGIDVTSHRLVLFVLFFFPYLSCFVCLFVFSHSFHRLLLFFFYLPIWFSLWLSDAAPFSFSLSFLYLLFLLLIVFLSDFFSFSLYIFFLYFSLIFSLLFFFLFTAFWSVSFLCLSILYTLFLLFLVLLCDFFLFSRFLRISALYIFLFLSFL